MQIDGRVHMVLKLPWKSLKKREWPYLAPFEYELMFREEHTGWVEYVGKNVFKLRKSPFSPLYSKWKYIAPKDKPPPDNAFVTLEGRETKKPVFKGNETLGNYSYVFEVEHWNENELEPPLPYGAEVERYLEDLSGVPFEGMLTMKEMLHLVSMGWKDAQNDGLDFALGALYLSCPPMGEKVGGIGTQYYALGSGEREKYRRYYSRYMKRILPKEFTTLSGSDIYYYVSVERESVEKRLERKMKDTRELNYSYIWKVPYRGSSWPVQIPFLLRDSRPRKINDVLPPDLLQYQLTGLMIRPKIDERLISEFEDRIVEVDKLMMKNDDLESNIDRRSIKKFAGTITRMHLRNELSEERFREAEDTFLEYYEEYLDYKEALKPLRGRGTTGKAGVGASYMKYNLNNTDIDVLKTIMRLWEEEYGKSWVPVEAVASKFKDRALVMESLYNLQTYGNIIQKMNFGMVKPIILESIADELE